MKRSENKDGLTAGIRRAVYGGGVASAIAALLVGAFSSSALASRAAHKASGMTIGEILLSPGAYQVAHAADFTKLREDSGYHSEDV